MTPDQSLDRDNNNKRRSVWRECSAGWKLQLRASPWWSCTALVASPKNLHERTHPITRAQTAWHHCFAL